MMSTDVPFDVVVVGAGIEGSATAYCLVKDNQKTLLIDQFPLPHTRGSSHGETRITRKAYSGTHYANMMITTYHMWQVLEREVNETLYRTGGLMIGKKGGSFVNDMAQALKDINADFDRLDHRDINKRFPMIRTSDGYEGVYDPDAGLIFADKALMSLWNQIKMRGGTIRDGEPVTSIVPGNPVVVVTASRQYKAGSVVLCLGPWTSQLTSSLGLSLPLQPIRVGVFYWADVAGQYSDMPCVVESTDDLLFYGLQSCEYPKHVKVCYHGGPPIDHDHQDAQQALAAAEKHETLLKAAVNRVFPGLQPEPSIRQTCTYTMTPDKDFIVDTHPQWKNIVIGAGFSGHGFKLAPVIGMVLSELATGRQPSFDLSPFKISRFKKRNAKI